MTPQAHNTGNFVALERLGEGYQPLMFEEYKQKIAQNLTALRRQLGYKSVSSFARALYVANSTLQGWEETGVVTWKMMFAIAKYCGEHALVFVITGTYSGQAPLRDRIMTEDPVAVADAVRAVADRIEVLACSNEVDPCLT